MTVEAIVRHDGNGHRHKYRGDAVVCWFCEGRARWGWAFGFGSIALVTCDSPRCRPASPPWVKGVAFVPGTLARKEGE